MSSMRQHHRLLAKDSLLPARFRFMFPFSHFNKMQSLVAEEAYNSDENLVIAAPTGSGKTAIHELALCRLIDLKTGEPMKVVYLAPTKALCQQKWNEWQSKFSALDQNVMEVTGDVDLKESLDQVAKASIIITTPEKWDSLTRQWRDHLYLLSGIDLLLVDEIHHLNDERGSTLEAVIVRMRFLANYDRRIEREITPSRSTERASLRIIALSATLPNISDIGEWLHCRQEHIHYFDDTFRPVPLEIRTFSYGTASNPFLYERSLDNRVGDLVSRFSANNQTIIFCSSKKNAESLAKHLTQDLRLRKPLTRPHYPVLANISDETMRKLLLNGIAYHHAGLPPDERLIVEHLFLAGEIQILCSTSTLSHGVNLPAHLVIVKGTYCWRGSSQGYQRLPRSDVIQMLGRAGRPGFDQSGVAIIMTNNEDLSFYSNITLSADTVVSKLEGMLHEALNAEISQKVVCSIGDCVKWLRNTYLYTCLEKGRVKLSPDDSSDAEVAINLIAQRTLNDLHLAKLISFKTDEDLLPTNESLIMARNLTKWKSMAALMKIDPASSLKQIMISITRCEELQRPVRRLEKKFLNEVMKTIRFPLKERVQYPCQKSYVLLQAAVSRISMKDFTLKVEQAEVVSSTIRLLRALYEVALCKVDGGLILENTILLERALKMRLWEGPEPNVFLQCNKLSPELITRLAESGVKNFLNIYKMTPGMLMTQFSCSVEEASSMQAFVRDLVHSKLMVELHASAATCKFTIRPAIKVDNRQYNTFVQYQLVCYDVFTKQLICHRHLPSGRVEEEYTIKTINFSSIANIRYCLLSNVVGLDWCGGATLDLTHSSATTTQNEKRNMESSKHANSESSLAKSRHPMNERNMEAKSANLFEQFAYKETASKIENIPPNPRQVVQDASSEPFRVKRKTYDSRYLKSLNKQTRIESNNEVSGNESEDQFTEDSKSLSSKATVNRSLEANLARNLCGPNDPSPFMDRNACVRQDPTLKDIDIAFDDAFM